MADSINQVLNRRYAPPEWVMFWEFALYGGDRRIDALAFSPWAARDHLLIGFEIKESRADWLRELRDLNKSEESSAYVDKWYLVAPKNIVLKEEIPEDWGYLEIRGSKCFTIKQAPKRQAVPVDRMLMARCIAQLLDKEQRRQTQERWDTEKTVRAEIEQRLKDKYNTANLAINREHEALKQVIKDFQEASGVELTHYSRGVQIGSIVKAILDGQIHFPNLEYPINQIITIKESLEAAKVEIDILAKLNFSMIKSNL